MGKACEIFKKPDKNVFATFFFLQCIYFPPKLRSGMSSSQCTFFKKLKLTEIFIEVTVASHAVVSNNTQGVPCTLCPVFPNGTILQNYKIKSLLGY